MSAMSDQHTPQPMDVDSPSPAPSSPVTENPPKTNGANGVPDGPAPPPHRYTKSPPPPTANYAATPEAATPPAEPPTIDAEEYKAAGNKFFKIKDYPRAIEEYSKGGLSHSVFASRAVLPAAEALHYTTPGRESG
jgi:DnaJ family protein C protein 7